MMRNSIEERAGDEVRESMDTIDALEQQMLVLDEDKKVQTVE